ncbi:MAG: segregation and condensation protein A [Chitinophagales bacterium]
MSEIKENYKIVLPQFEGPFDLLLFFIERDELNIYDIPIFEITKDFLDYIHQLETLNIEVASDFILVAATLMRIKSKMLIPRKQLDDEGNEIDPREELVQRLIEYKQYKEVVEQLKDLETTRLLQKKRGNIEKEVKHIAEMYSTENELHSLDLYKLMKAFQKVIEKMEYRENKVIHTVVKYRYTIKNQKGFVLQNIKGKTKFEEIFLKLENRIHAVFTFLAMLELIQESLLKINIGEGKNNFWVSLD